MSGIQGYALEHSEHVSTNPLNPCYPCSKKRGKGVWDVIQPNTKVFNPLCIDMYNLVAKNSVKDIPSRTGNWIQPFFQIGDIIKFVDKQFGDIDYIKDIIASKSC